MDVQALDSVVTVLPPSGPAQSQSRADSSSAPGATAGSAAAAPVRPASGVDAAAPAIDPSGHVAYKLVTSPVQTVVVFTNASGTEVLQFPPQQLIALEKFDRATGSHVDRGV